MKPVLAVLTRPRKVPAVQQYAVVVLAVAATLGVSLLVHSYAYPRPLFLLTFLISAWGRGLGPSLLGAHWLPRHQNLYFPSGFQGMGLFPMSSCSGWPPSFQINLAVQSCG